MKNKGLLIAISLFLTFLISCTEDKYFDINRDTWILLKDKDTVLFHSENNTDTFYIKDIGTYYEDIDKTNYYQHLHIDYEKIHNGIIDITLLYNIHRTYKNVNINWDNFISQSFYRSIIPFNFTIDLRIFENVYKVDNYFESDIDTDVKTIYYTDKYGVIAYELNNGAIYKIDVNCITFDSD